jgi:hypothetical protein
VKALIPSFGFRHVALAAVCLVMLLPAAVQAQHLTMLTPSFDRRTFIAFYANDFQPGSSQTVQPFFSAITNTAGEFNVAGHTATPGTEDFTEVTAACNIAQDTVVAATTTSLSITGQLEIVSSGSAVNLSDRGGTASWAGSSALVIGFSIDRPFTYTLSANTLLNTNTTELVPRANVGLDTNGGAGEQALPNYVAYGSTVDSGHTAYYAPASGTNTGVLPAGNYYMNARVQTQSGVDGDHSPMAEHFLVAFNLSVSYVPPQPPVITAFTPDGAGGYNLIWNAPQAGNYRVLTSADLMGWSEAIPSAAASTGLNTNTISAGPGAAFFRMEYLP